MPPFSALFAAVPFCLEAQESDASKARRIEQVVSHYQKIGYFNGTILVADGGKVIYTKGVGDANMVSHTPNTPQTASLSAVHSCWMRSSS